MSIVARRISTPPVIDRVFDEPCWSEAQVATDFTNRKAERLATEQTLAGLLYDDENDVNSVFVKAVYWF